MPTAVGLVHTSSVRSALLNSSKGMLLSVFCFRCSGDNTLAEVQISLFPATSALTFQAAFPPADISEVPHHGGRSPSPARCFMSSPGAVAALLDVDVHQGLDALQTHVTGCPRRQRNGRDLQVLLRRVQTVLINFLWLRRHPPLLREARLGHQMLLALARV